MARIFDLDQYCSNGINLNQVFMLQCEMFVRHNPQELKLHEQRFFPACDRASRRDDLWACFGLSNWIDIMDTSLPQASVSTAGAVVSAFIENVTYDEITVGQKAVLSRVLRRQDIELFAQVSGDTNPAHLDAEYAAGTMFKGVIGHGIWSASIVSAVLGTCLPGPGTIYLSQDLKFRRPVTRLRGFAGF
jgi:hypothetical protein